MRLRPLVPGCGMREREGDLVERCDGWTVVVDGSCDDGWHRLVLEARFGG